MPTFNVYGLIIVAAILIPNVVFAVKNKDGFENVQIDKRIEIIEQTGRFGCFIFMIVNVPGTCFGWWFLNALTVYLITDAFLTAAYVLIWIICFKRNSLFRALALSIIPSVMFLASGVITASVLLLAVAALFAPSHIYISYKNATALKKA